MRIAPPSLPPHHSDPAARDFQSSIPAMEEASTSRRKVRRWVPHSLLWWPTSTWSSLRTWHWRRHRPDPGCGRGMLMTLSASSGRAQLKNSYTISMGSGRPSSSLWSRKRMGHSHSSTRYSGGERMAAWTSLSTGSPRTQTGIFTLSPIIRPT